MPKILVAQFPEADYNHGSNASSSSQVKNERLDTENNYDSKEIYVPRARIFLAEKPSASKEQGELSYFRCKVLYESFKDLQKAYLNLCNSAYKPFKLSNDLLGSQTAFIVCINFAGQPCELTLSLSPSTQYEKQNIEIVN